MLRNCPRNFKAECRGLDLLTEEVGIKLLNAANSCDQGQCYPLRHIIAYIEMKLKSNEDDVLRGWLSVGAVRLVRATDETFATLHSDSLSADFDPSHRTFPARQHDHDGGLVVASSLSPDQYTSDALIVE